MKLRMPMLLGLLLAELFVVASTAETQSPETTIVVPNDFYGIMHTGYSSDSDQEYKLLNELGAIWVQRDFSWNAIEPADDQWKFESFDAYVDRANKEGKKVLGMLLYDVQWVHVDKRRSGPYVAVNEIGQFCQYVRETVRRYNGRHGHGKVDARCIWNEPNLADRFWRGTKEEFFALTKETAKTVRELDAQEGTRTTLVGGAFNTLVMLDLGWVDGLFESGAMEQVDAIAFHPYMPSADGSAYIFRQFKARAAKYGFADKIRVTEIGYPTAPSMNYFTEVDEARMPEMTVKTCALLAAEGAQKLFWYQLFDPERREAANSEDWFGLVWNRAGGWQKKGGYFGYALCARHLPGKTLVARKFPGAIFPMANCRPAISRAMRSRWASGATCLLCGTSVLIAM